MSSNPPATYTYSQEVFEERSPPKPTMRRHDPYYFHGSDSPATSASTAFTPVITPNVSFSTATPPFRPETPVTPVVALPPPAPTGTDLTAYRGQLADFARTAAGSSLMQSSLQGAEASTTYELLLPELLPVAEDLLLDCHGCYAMRALMEHMPLGDVGDIAQRIANDEAMQFSLCTHSLHTRRIAQYLMDAVGAFFLESVLTTRCDEVATTQQGCIVIQRAMDVARHDLRRRILLAVYANAAPFAVDAFGNYVVQHAIDVDSPESSSHHLWHAFGGRVVELSCNKFASNVMEKCLHKFLPAMQHQVIMEMYNATEDTLLRMMHDSFGNYIIQSSIAAATLPDVEFISSRLSNVVQQSPYGHKLVSRIDRRLRGAGGMPHCSSGGRHMGKGAHRKHTKRPIPIAPIVDHTVEESW